MGDNKDFSTPEQEVETKADSDTDTKTENQTSDSKVEQNTDNSYDLNTFDDSSSKAEFENNDTPLETTTPPTVVKKKPFIQLPVIIAAALVLAVALGLFVFKGFFDTSLPGTWIFEQELQTSTSTEDESETDSTKILNYFTFKDDGELTVTVGTISYIGSYSISDDSENNGKILTMYVPSVINGTFNMEVSGNIFSGRTLALTNTSSTDTKFELKSGKYTAPEIKRDGDFTPNEDLIGKWTYDDGLYNLSFEFNKDGTATYTENKQIKFDGIYSYTDSTITLTYYTIEEATMETDYTVSDGSIVINGITFTKETDSTADEG